MSARRYHSKAEKAKKLKASAINALLNVLSAMLNLAVKWGNLKDSPFKAVKMLKVDKTEPPSLSAEDANRLLEACRGDRDLYTFTALGLHTGMRIGEIVNITWADADMQRRIVKVRPKTAGEGVREWRVKTGDIRDIPVSDFLADVLARHPRHITCPYVLCRPDRTPYDANHIRGRMERARKRGGLVRAYPHLLRHTFGTTLAANGYDIDTIRRLMGHTEIKMTMRYLHAAPNTMSAAVESLPFWPSDCTEFGQSGESAESGKRVRHCDTGNYAGESSEPLTCDLNHIPLG